jgi:hypothetical protein
MLDLLPKAEVDDNFTRSTVELVALAAEAEVREQETTRRNSAWRGLLAGAAAIGVTAVIGFAVSRWLIPTENDRLVRDLPVLEQLDAYLVGDGVEFAQQLVQADLFQGGEDETFAWDETPAERIARIEQMPSTERDMLRRKQDRLANLDPEQQRQVRELNAALAAQPDRDQLLATLVAYRNWRSDLSPEERAALSQIKPQERIAKIRAMQADQEKRALAKAAKELSPDDARIIRRWIDDYAKAHSAELKQRFSKREQDSFSNAKDASHEEWIVRGRLLREVFENRKFPEVSADDRNRLIGLLSPDAKATWDRARTDQQKNDVLVGWVGTAAMHGFRGPGRFRPPGPIDKDEVRQFIDNLPDDERAKLNGMRHEDQVRYYFEQKFKHGKRPSPHRDGGPKRREGPPPFDKPPRDREKAPPREPLG